MGPNLNSSCVFKCKVSKQNECKKRKYCFHKCLGLKSFAGNTLDSNLP